MIDSHCHLDFDAYDNDRDRVVSDARAAGIDTIINIGVDVAASRRSIELAEKYDMVYATVGIHPHDAKTADQKAIDTLRDLAKHPKVVAIGEIGLDYYRNLSPRNVQQKAFHQQLELACEMKLPVVIHTRESFDDSLNIIRQYAGRLSGGVFHCFPGS
ncbi:MAG: TatD family hydrolase, partial [Candidatus Zixiibacteriota bacterium]